MKEIDKTKHNIRLDRIDDGQRKELFNKFKDAGGKVLTEKEQRRSLVIDREKQRQHQQKLDQHFSNKRIPKTDSSSVKKTATIKKGRAGSSAPESSPFDKFRIRWRLRLQGITGFNTVFFKKRFFKKFTDEYKPALIEIQVIFLALFKRDPKTGNRIINSLDKTSPLFYELIEKAGEIYESYLIDQIVEGYVNYPDVPQSLSELRESMSAIFKPIYLLKPYENTLYNSFERSIDLGLSYSEGKKDKTISKRDLKNSLFVIFNKLYPRLHTLFCHYQGILFTESDKRIEDILGIIQSEKPGNRIRRSESLSIQAEQDTESEQKTETKETSNNLLLSDPIREGLKIMYKLDNKTLRGVYDKKNKYEYLNDSDKVLLAYMLFLEFEKEYSFILTTNQIKYNIDFSAEGKKDYRTRLQDLFNRLNKCRDAFGSYYETYLEYIKVFNQKPINNDQYIAYSKRVDEIANKKKQAGSLVRMTIRSFMENLASELGGLIEDMNGEQKFISNPQDILEFSYEIEGDKKLKNRKIFEAVEIIYNYASAFVYRLSNDGDLSGKLEFDENDKKTETESVNSGIKKESGSESLFDELDDII
jgi:hypothetical protein